MIAHFYLILLLYPVFGISITHEGVFSIVHALAETFVDLGGDDS
jgi:uncharacterized protein (DUF697 family)